MALESRMATTQISARSSHPVQYLFLRVIYTYLQMVWRHTAFRGYFSAGKRSIRLGILCVVFTEKLNLRYID